VLVHGSFQLNSSNRRGLHRSERSSSSSHDRADGIAPRNRRLLTQLGAPCYVDLLRGAAEWMAANWRARLATYHRLFPTGSDTCVDEWRLLADQTFALLLSQRAAVFPAWMPADAAADDAPTLFSSATAVFVPTEAKQLPFVDAASRMKALPLVSTPARVQSHLNLSSASKLSPARLARALTDELKTCGAAVGAPWRPADLSIACLRARETILDMLRYCARELAQLPGTPLLLLASGACTVFPPPQARAGVALPWLDPSGEYARLLPALLDSLVDKEASEAILNAASSPCDPAGRAALAPLQRAAPVDVVCNIERSGLPPAWRSAASVVPVAPAELAWLELFRAVCEADTTKATAALRALEGQPAAAAWPILHPKGSASSFTLAALRGVLAYPDLGTSRAAVWLRKALAIAGIACVSEAAPWPIPSLSPETLVRALALAASTRGGGGGDVLAAEGKEGLTDFERGELQRFVFGCLHPPAGVSAQHSVDRALVTMVRHLHIFARTAPPGGWVALGDSDAWRAIVPAWSDGLPQKWPAALHNRLIQARDADVSALQALSVAILDRSRAVALLLEAAEQRALTAEECAATLAHFGRIHGFIQDQGALHERMLRAPLVFDCASPPALHALNDGQLFDPDVRVFRLCLPPDRFPCALAWTAVKSLLQRHVNGLTVSALKACVRAYEAAGKLDDTEPVVLLLLHCAAERHGRNGYTELIRALVTARIVPVHREAQRDAWLADLAAVSAKLGPRTGHTARAAGGRHLCPRPARSRAPSRVRSATTSGLRCPCLLSKGARSSTKRWHITRAAARTLRGWRRRCSTSQTWRSIRSGSSRRRSGRSACRTA
jgi:hypothetical protein